MSAPPAIRHQTEREFQTGVVQYARLNGWRCYHTHNSRRSEIRLRPPDDPLHLDHVPTAVGGVSSRQRTELLRWLHGR